MESEDRASVEFMEGVQEGMMMPSTSSTREEEGTTETNNGGWAALPDVVLERIFTQLSRPDRVSASLVCQNWSRTFHAPNLWRKIVVNLHDATLDSLQRFLHFTRRYGNYLHDLEITYHRTCLLTRRDLERQLTRLFDDIQGRPQLATFKFRNFLFKRDWRSSALRTKLLNSLCNFLKTQRSMTDVDITRLDANVNEGTRLLQAIANGSSDTIQSLLLQDFFHSRQAVFRNGKYLRLIEDFKHLEVIALNYSCICEEVVAYLAQNGPGRLRSLLIKCRGSDVHHQTISSNTWRRLKGACPNVRVDFIIEQINDWESLERLVPCEVPLRHLNYWSGYLSEEEDTLEPINFISHVLTHFPNTLEDLELDCDENITMVDAVLEAFLPGLRNLNRLVLTAVLPVSFVQDVCIQLVQRQINLTVFRAKLVGTSREDYERLQNVVSTFQQQEPRDDSLYFDVTSDWPL